MSDERESEHRDGAPTADNPAPIPGPAPGETYEPSGKSLVVADEPADEPQDEAETEESIPEHIKRWVLAELAHHGLTRPADDA